MPNKSKYLLLLSLIGLLALPVLLLAGLQTAQYVLRKVTAQRFEKDSLQTLIVAEQDVAWEEKDRELRIGDRFFDITELVRKDGKLLLKGHFDEAETKVWKALQGALRQKGATIINQLILLLQCVYPAPLLWFVFQLSAHCTRSFPAYLLHLPSAILKVPFTPPRSTAP